MMSDNIVQHPHRDLMAEAEHERGVADSPEAERLKDAIFKAVNAYSEFLEREGVIWDEKPEIPRLKAEALVITVDYAVEAGGTIDITLKNGACDRVFGNGVNPDAYGQGPSDIPHKQRRED
jgi:hypothetical protein